MKTTGWSREEGDYFLMGQSLLFFTPLIDGKNVNFCLSAWNEKDGGKET